MTSRRDGIPTLVSDSGVSSQLDRVTFGDREIDEGWLQNLMFENPGILPINELDPGFGPLIPIGREIGTEVGPIDNLYISPNGMLTIVEAKLWRNPQARREVVGQIIDYAKELSHWHYQKLDEATQKASGKKLWELVNETNAPELSESQFIDTVARNLQAGRFLLLIVGDGIREEMERMAAFLQGTPQLRFSLAMIELQVYRFSQSQDMLVIPFIVSRTKEISRAIVKVVGATGTKVDVSLDISDPDATPKTRSRRTLTHEEFFEELQESGISEDGVKVAHQIHDEYSLDDRFLIDWKMSSFSLKLRDPVESSIMYTILVVEWYGTAYIGWLESQLERTGLPSKFAHEYADATRKLVERRIGNSLDQWEKSVSLDKIAEVYGEFKNQIEILAHKVYASRGEED